MTKHSRHFGFELPTAEEDAAINAGIAADPDTFELSEAEMAALRPLPRRGRPAVAVPRPMLSMRVDADVLAALRATGPGWQTRINALLREALEQGRLG
ncbi:MAG: BrnA antitoxin family protein [Burkholderiaceae bacterium]|nr:BrnA antitoxin family protein [Burkholderiaceae bacterium]